MTNIDTTDARARQENADRSRGPEAVPAPEADQDGMAETDPAIAAEEIGGPKGPEPTRYGDWEKKGRCIDF